MRVCTVSNKIYTVGVCTLKRNLIECTPLCLICDANMCTLPTHEQLSQVKVRPGEIDKWLSSVAHTQEGNRQRQSLNHKAPE